MIWAALIVSAVGWCTAAPPEPHEKQSGVSASSRAPLVRRRSQSRVHAEHLLDGVYRTLPDPVSLNVCNADITDVCAAACEQAGLSCVFDRSVRGFVPRVCARDVRLGNLLRSLCESNMPALGVVREGSLLRILSHAAALRICEKQIETGSQQDLTSCTVSIRHAAWSERFKLRVEQMWEQCCGQYPGNAKVNYFYCDDGSKTVLFQGTKDQTDQMRRLLAALDIPRYQVLIHARLVLAHKDFERAFGVDWDMVFDRRAAGRGLPLVGVGSLVSKGTRPAVKTTIPSSKGSNFDLPIVFGDPTLSSRRLQVMLDAAENDNKMRTILKPSLVARDGQQAELLEGHSVPIESLIEESVEGRTRSTRSAQYKDVGIKLRVKPDVSSNGQLVTLSVFVENSHLEKGVGSYPTITTTRAQTSVSLKSGQTTMIGGLLKATHEDGQAGVPWLSRLPLIGSLFSGARSAHEQNQLLIFLTPHALKIGA